MLQPNTKSLLPDRFGKRIISTARIIFAAHIMEAYEGGEQRDGSRPEANLCGTLDNGERVCSRCYLNSSLKTPSSTHKSRRNRRPRDNSASRHRQSAESTSRRGRKKQQGRKKKKRRREGGEPSHMKGGGDLLFEQLLAGALPSVTCI